MLKPIGIYTLTLLCFLTTTATASPTITLHVTFDSDPLPADCIFLVWCQGQTWTKRLTSSRKLEPIQLENHATEVHVLGYNNNSLIFQSGYIDQKIGRNDVEIELKPGQISYLQVEEVQSEKPIASAEIVLQIGLPFGKALELEFFASNLRLDTPPGLLVIWKVKASKHHGQEIDSAFTPFNHKTRLLRTVDLHVHVCLSDSEENGADKEARVEAIMEYEWASQNDGHKIVEVDGQGDVLFNQVPAPWPSENLNVTLISKLRPQSYLSSRHRFHRPRVHHVLNVAHDVDEPVKVDLCHALETVAVLVTNGVTGWRMSGVEVSLSVLNNYEQMKTNEDGVAVFSIDDDFSRIHLVVNHPNFDEVSVTKVFHMAKKGQTEMINIKLFPQKIVHVEVRLETDTYYQPPAIGAVIDWNADQDEGIVGVDGNGQGILVLSGGSDKLYQLSAFIPWQSTCSERSFAYGLSQIIDQKFPLSQRPPFETSLQLTLPRITRIQYEVELEGLFPEVAQLHTESSHGTTRRVDVESSIRHDKASFDIDVGSLQAFLHLVEGPEALVVVAPLAVCFDVDPQTLSQSRRQSIYDRTVKVTVKLMDSRGRPFHNATLQYLIGYPSFDFNTIEADDEEAMVTFHVPKGTVVHLEAFAHGHHFPRGSNPNHFQAQDHLEVTLIMDERHGVPINLWLEGPGFLPPPGTTIKYSTRRLSGELEPEGIIVTDESGKATLEVSRATQILELSIGGSDGFDPVFFQPFEVEYRISEVHHHQDIRIPIETWQNLIVSVKDCMNGEILDTEALVTVATDMWPEGQGQYADRQGMAFFQIEPDVMIPVHVTAPEYRSFSTKVNIASNTTHLIEADLCRKIQMKVRVVDNKNIDRGINRATVAVSLDGGPETEIITDSRGEAVIHTTSDVKKYEVGLVDSDYILEQPIIKVNDENFFRDNDVNFHLLQRRHTIELMTVSCRDYIPLGSVAVTFQIDHHHAFSRTSDASGLVRLRVNEDARVITARILDESTDISVLPKEDLPPGLEFRSISQGVSISMNLMDGDRGDLPVAHASVMLSWGSDPDSSIHVVTDPEGSAKLQLPPHVRELRAQLLESPGHVLQPKFYWRDECGDFLRLGGLQIHVLDRMHTIRVATVSCQDFQHYGQVPVLVQTLQDDDQREEVLVSDSQGIVKLRLKDSPANVTLTVLDLPPQAPPDLTNLGLMALDPWPDLFTLTFKALPKTIGVQVNDGNQYPLPMTPVNLHFYDQAENRHISRQALTDDQGHAFIEVDGCVEFATFIVSPPLTDNSLCSGSTVYEPEKRLHWNILDQHRFSISLSPKAETSRLLRLRSDLRLHGLTYTTDGDPHTRREVDPNFLWQNWYANVKTSDKRLHLLSEAEHFLGLAFIDLCCHKDKDFIGILENTVQVTVRVQDTHDRPLHGAQVRWQVGMELGAPVVPTSAEGKISLHAPSGYLLALEVVDCKTAGGISLITARQDLDLTLTCL